MKKFKKIIMFIPCLILLLVLSFSFYNVVAEDGELVENPDACQNLFDSEGKVIISSVYDKYNPTITHVSGKEWKIEINPSDPNDSSVIERLKDVKFQLVKINDRNITNGGLVGYEEPLTITEEIDEYGYMSLLFRVSKEHKDPDCALETLEFDAEVFIGGSGPVYTIEPTPNVSIVPLPPEKLNEIECPYTGETVSDEGQFKKYFCEVKENADYNYEDQFDNGKKFSDKAGSNAFATFKCDSENVYSLEDIQTNTRLNADDGYYLPINTGYLYGSGTYKMDNGNYIYRYDPCHPTTGAKIECSVTCEEIVTVKYGAPVASKAGLCFEYKVKVTSNVVCDMTTPPPLPEYNPSVCTPTPYCTGIGKNGNRYTLHQGGPNEDYDRCIQACDGGKYTSSCSKQCYKEVYQNSLISYEPKKTDSCCTDCYTNGGSTWLGDGPGRWYGGSCKSGYAAPWNGICRRIKSSGYCNDDCWWSGCGDDEYLNPGYASEDYENNIELYNQAVNACKAAASCSTTTATFTISVDYKDGSGNKVTVDFPYETEPDKACVSCSPKVGSNNVTLTAVDGCYKSSSGAEDYYFAEWRFPGSWINKKTGELSYLDKKGNDAWQEVRGKFCIPFDAQDVNAKWWNYYYNKVYGSNQCSQMSKTPDEYNIRAVTKNFGYFGWNIKASCFYAVNNTEKAPCPEDPDEPNDDIKYIIRSIDLDDVFPKTSGESLTNPNEEVGRTPGFNWSSKARNEKNEGYVSSPLQYALNIQEKGFSIYSDSSQMDYQIYLTPEDLNKLKRARSSDYTKYLGKHDLDKNGVIRFNSDLLDELARPDRNVISVRVTEGGFACNNTVFDGYDWKCEEHE